MDHRRTRAAPTRKALESDEEYSHLRSTILNVASQADPRLEVLFPRQEPVDVVAQRSFQTVVSYSHGAGSS